MRQDVADGPACESHKEARRSGRPVVTIRQVVEAAVSVVFAVDLKCLEGPSRGEARVALARQVSMYLAHCAFGLTHAEIGRAYNRDRTTVGHACAVVEGRRDDPVFDRTLSNLEEIVRRVGSVCGLRPGAEA